MTVFSETFRIQWNPSIRTLWNKDTSIKRTVFAVPNTTFVYFQPLKSGHLANQDTFWGSKVSGLEGFHCILQHCLMCIQEDGEVHVLAASIRFSHAADENAPYRFILHFVSLPPSSFDIRYSYKPIRMHTYTASAYNYYMYVLLLLISGLLYTDTLPLKQVLQYVHSGSPPCIYQETTV